MGFGNRVTKVTRDDRNFSTEFDPNVTINTLLDEYLADRRNPYADHPCKHPEALADHLKPIRAVWGDLPFWEFVSGSKKRVQQQIEKWRREEGWQVGTCRKRMSTFKAALNYAYGEERIERVPPFKLPPSGPPRERYLDPVTELPALLKAADDPSTADHIRLCLHLSLRTGQRQSAIRDLKWANVDFENRVIRFRDTEKAAERSKKQRANMPMDEELYRLLEQAESNAETEYVLEWQGRRVKSTYAGMKALYARAGIQGLHRHDLRRSAATLAYRASGDMKQAANFLCDTEVMARKHYAMASEDERLAPVIAISDVLAKARKAG